MWNIVGQRVLGNRKLFLNEAIIILERKLFAGSKEIVWEEAKNDLCYDVINL